MFHLNYQGTFFRQLKTFTFAVAAISIPTYALQLDTVWTKSYGGPARNEIYSVIPCYDGSYFLCGCAGHSFSTGSRAGSKDDFRIMKIDSSGDTLWEKKYGSYLSDTRAWGAVERPNGTFAIMGDEYTDAGAYNLYALMVDSLGDSLFSKKYQCSTAVQAFSTDSMGGFAVLTATEQLGTTIQILDSSLTITSKITCGPAPCYANDLLCIGKGKFIIAGTNYLSVWYAIIDSKTGKVFDTSGLYDIIPESEIVKLRDNSGYLIAYNTEVAKGYGWGLVWIDPNGTIVKTKTYGAKNVSTPSIVRELIQTSDNGFLLGTLNGGTVVYRLNSSGDLLYSYMPRSVTNSDVDIFTLVETSPRQYMIPLANYVGYIDQILLIKFIERESAGISPYSSHVHTRIPLGPAVASRQIDLLGRQTGIAQNGQQTRGIPLGKYKNKLLKVNGNCTFR